MHSRPCLASGPRASGAQLRLRPVRPARSAWHEMPGHASARLRRPARAALSWTPPCDGWNAWRVAGRWWICGCRGCVLVAAGYVPALMRMRTRVRRSWATERRVGGARLRAGLTGRNRRVRSVDRKSRARQILSRRTAVRGQNATANAPVKVRGSQHTRLRTTCITASKNAGDSD